MMIVCFRWMIAFNRYAWRRVIKPKEKMKWKGKMMVMKDSTCMISISIRLTLSLYRRLTERKIIYDTTITHLFSKNCYFETADIKNKTNRILKQRINRYTEWVIVRLVSFSHKYISTLLIFYLLLLLLDQWLPAHLFMTIQNERQETEEKKIWKDETCSWNRIVWRSCQCRVSVWIAECLWYWDSTRKFNLS